MTRKPPATDTARRPLATAEEVSEYLGVPVATLYAWRTRNKGPRGGLVGRHIRYRWSDVDAWLNAQMTPAST